ncbi:methylglyoxal synthase [Parafilimonas terrae]|uniref:Methylglyoxal synthase n=1 Tax=Parafilimonas terrae TaxID=1465490 RepID=A0A1I5XCL5_9BACT|nr:methylglyoxal synthase [Parafilimonas terrae]SFQ29719.1 methylglyoxal synthase [Parafilimonas terrae]
MNKIKHIAIIASPDNKTDLIEWSYFNKDALAKHEILASGNTANILEGTLNKKVNVSESGKPGEYSALRNLIEENKIDALIMFNDAEEIMHNRSLYGILETAIKNNIIIATNRTTADFVINSKLIDNEYKVSTDEKKIANKNTFTVAKTYPLAKAS